MQRRALLAAMAATGVTLAAPIMASAQTDTGTATATSRGVDVTQTYPITGYAPINGLQIYYEIHGSGGTPLLLLHGGIVGSVTFAPLLPGLSANRQVITIDLQGHGHTRDFDRPLREETMADDVAGVLAHMEVEQADLLGYSMGGGVALQTAFRHPKIVRKLVIVSATMRHDGSYPEVLAQLDQLESNAPQLGAQVAQSPLATVYPEADWETLFAKAGEMASRDYDWSANVAAITAPSMLIFADADSIRILRDGTRVTDLRATTSTSFDLTAVTYAAGAPVSGRTVAWQSSNEAVIRSLRCFTAATLHARPAPVKREAVIASSRTRS